MKARIAMLLVACLLLSGCGGTSSGTKTRESDVDAFGKQLASDMNEGKVEHIRSELSSELSAKYRKEAYAPGRKAKGITWTFSKAIVDGATGTVALKWKTDEKTGTKKYGVTKESDKWVLTDYPFICFGEQTPMTVDGWTAFSSSDGKGSWAIVLPGVHSFDIEKLDGILKMPYEKLVGTKSPRGTFAIKPRSTGGNTNMAPDEIELDDGYEKAVVEALNEKGENSEGEDCSSNCEAQRGDQPGLIFDDVTVTRTDDPYHPAIVGTYQVWSGHYNDECGYVRKSIDKKLTVYFDANGLDVYK